MNTYGTSKDRVLTELERMISTGLLKSGAHLPGERQLAERLETSRATVRIAVQELVERGQLVRLPRKGTVVAPNLGPTDDNKLGCVAVVVPAMDCIAPRLIAEIERQAGNVGMGVYICHSAADSDYERLQVYRAIERGAKSVAIVPTLDPGHKSRMRDSLLYLCELALPVVILDHLATEVPLSDIDCVLSDNYAGGYLATAHLIDKGYQNVSIIHTCVESLAFTERKNGYLAALKDFSLNVPEGPVVDTADLESPDSTVIQELVKCGTNAFFATNDRNAVLLLNHIRRLGLKVPQEVAIIGYDNESYMDLMDPPLSSVNVEVSVMANLAVQFLTERLTNQQPGRHRVRVVRPSIKVRESTRPQPRYLQRAAEATAKI